MDHAGPGTNDLARGPAGVPFREAVRAWLRVGLLSFGGPAGQVALLHRVVVEEKKWISEARFLHALNACMLLPGPEAQQLATYVGWLLHGVRGGLVAGTLFVLPGFIVLLVLSFVHARFGQVSGVSAAFFGLKAAVVAIVAHAVVGLGRRALRSAALRLVALVAFVATFLFEAPFPAVIGMAALAGLALGRWRPQAIPVPHPREDDRGGEPDASARPRPSRSAATAVVWLVLWLAPVAALVALLGRDHVLAREAVLFSKAASVSFGGAYAVLSYVSHHAVETFSWLTPGEMLDGLGLAETTPGPLILVLEYVGFTAAWKDPGALPPAAAGVAGALVTGWVTFVPSFLWIFTGAPWFEALRGVAALQRALAAITAAVVGVVLDLAAWFSLHVAFADVAVERAGPFRLLVPRLATADLAAILLAAAAAVALFRLRMGLGRVILAAAAAGVVVRLQ